MKLEKKIPEPTTPDIRFSSTPPPQYSRIFFLLFMKIELSPNSSKKKNKRQSAKIFSSRKQQSDNLHLSTGATSRTDRSPPTVTKPPMGTSRLSHPTPGTSLIVPGLNTNRATPGLFFYFVFVLFCFCFVLFLFCFGFIFIFLFLFFFFFFLDFLFCFVLVLFVSLFVFLMRVELKVKRKKRNQGRALEL